MENGDLCDCQIDKKFPLIAQLLIKSLELGSLLEPAAMKLTKLNSYKSYLYLNEPFLFI